MLSTKRPADNKDLKGLAGLRNNRAKHAVGLFRSRTAHVRCSRARSPKRRHPDHHREDRQSPENTRHTHEPIERDKERRGFAGAGTAPHEQSQNNEQSDRHRQQTTARPHMMTMIRHEIRRNPAPRSDIRKDSKTNTRDTHKPNESDEKWGEITGAGTAHEQ